MQEIKDILLEIGYSNISDNGKELRMKPIYRDSSSNTVLSVRKNNGYFIDFSANISGSFQELVKLSLNLKSAEEAKQWLGGKVQITERSLNEKSKIQNDKTEKAPKVLKPEYLLKIIPDHKYWINRGVSQETLEEFKGGVVEAGIMAKRYVFPIFNYNGELTGLAGRDLTSGNDKRPKWKHYGGKASWKYPLKNNFKIIRQKKEVILVESIGDMLALWDCGIKNSIVTFGLDVSTEVLNSIIKADPDKIYVSFNDDSKNNNAGNLAAEKAEKKFKKFFDPNQINIKLPSKCDFGEMTKEEIKSWHE